MILDAKRSWLRQTLRNAVPPETRNFARGLYDRLTGWPPYRLVRFGSFSRVTPICRGFDHSRGMFIDRYYIDQFMQPRSSDIRGYVLEIGDDIYTRLFGGEGVYKCDILDVRPDSGRATIIGDLTVPDCITPDVYDCAIVTQTMNYIYDVRAAMRTIHRSLKPGGSLLLSVSGISQIAPQEAQYCGDFWRFTSASTRRLLEDFFPAECVEVVAYGNVLSAISFLHGLAAEELKKADLDFNDPDYQLVICARATKRMRSDDLCEPSGN